jgi:hypothetical protein
MFNAVAYPVHACLGSVREPYGSHPTEMNRCLSAEAIASKVARKTSSSSPEKVD